MPRRRWIIALAILISLLVAIEILVRRWEYPKATLQITNDSDGILEDLVISYGETRMPVGSVPKGRSVHLRVTAGPMGRLRLDYRNKSNPLQSFWIDDYDPSQHVKDGSKQVLVIQPRTIQRYVEEDDTQSDQGLSGARIMQWFRDELDPFK